MVCLYFGKTCGGSEGVSLESWLKGKGISQNIQEEFWGVSGGGKRSGLNFGGVGGARQNMTNKVYWGTL